VTSTIRKETRFKFGLQFTQSKREAANSLPALKPRHYLSIRLTHLQMSQSCCPNLSVTSSAKHVWLVAK